MSVIPVLSRESLIRVARVFAITLTFVCAGPLIQLVLVGILIIGLAIVSGAGDATGWIIGLTARFIWPTLISLAVGAGITGLITGVYDAACVRVNARTMLIISLVVALAGLSLFVWRSASVLISVLNSHPKALWGFLWPVVFQRVCFVVSMMACWKLIDIVRGRTSVQTPAAGSFAPK
jgi:hypothetical protein